MKRNFRKPEFDADGYEVEPHLDAPVIAVCPTTDKRILYVNHPDDVEVTRVELTEPGDPRDN
jgi:hypothetical protein